MNEQEAREKLMDYLYNEMDDAEKVRFEAYLAENPELKNELKELKSTRTVLTNTVFDIPDASPFSQPYNPAENTAQKPAKQPRFYSLMKTGFAAAAALLIGVMLLAFANLQAGITDDGFYLTIGNSPVQQNAQPGITEEQVIELLEQIREENTVLMAALTEQSLRQQNDQLEEALSLLTAYFQQQRRQDLLLIAEGISQLEENTYYRFLQTDEALDDILYALSNQ